MLVKNFTYYDDKFKRFFIINDIKSNPFYTAYRGIDLTTRLPVEYTEDNSMIDFVNQYNIISKGKNWLKRYREDGYTEEVFDTLFLMNEKFTNKKHKAKFGLNLIRHTNKKEARKLQKQTFESFKGLYWSKSIGVYEIVAVSNNGTKLHLKDGLIVVHNTRRASTKIKPHQKEFLEHLYEAHSSLEHDYFDNKEELKILFELESYLRSTNYLENLSYMDDNYGKSFSAFDYRENLLLAYDLFKVSMIEDFEKYRSEGHELFKYKEYNISEEELQDYDLDKLCRSLEHYYWDLEGNGTYDFKDTLKSFLLSNDMYFGWHVELARSPITDCRIYVLTSCRFDNDAELNHSWIYDYTEYTSRDVIFDLLDGCKL